MESAVRFRRCAGARGGESRFQVRQSRSACKASALHALLYSHALPLLTAGDADASGALARYGQSPRVTHGAMTRSLDQSTPLLSWKMYMPL